MTNKPAATLEQISNDIAHLNSAPHLVTCKIGTELRIRFDISTIGNTPISKEWVRVWHRTDSGWKYVGVEMGAKETSAPHWIEIGGEETFGETPRNLSRRPRSMTKESGEPLKWSEYEGDHLKIALLKLSNYVQSAGSAAPPSPQQVGLIIQYFKLWIFSPYWDGETNSHPRPDIRQIELTHLRKTAENLTTADECAQWLCTAIAMNYNPIGAQADG